MAEDPQPMTLQQRIASLNAAHIGRVPGEPPRFSPKPIPQVPARRPVITKHKSINNPPEQLNGSITDIEVGNRPAPPPLPTRKQPPPLPSRKTSQDDGRRGSVESLASTLTNDGNGARLAATRTTSSDRLKAPAWGECELPALPEKSATTAPRKYSSDRPKYVNRAPSSTASITPASTGDSRKTSQPALPPRLPTRRAEIEHHEPTPEPESRMIPPVTATEAIGKIKKSALLFGMNKPQSAQELAQEPPTVIGRQPSTALPLVPSGETIDKIKKSVPSFGLNKPHSTQEAVQERPATNGALPSSVPPPVPLSSRPDLSAVQATKPKLASSTSVVNGSTSTSGEICLICRDFSGPDHYATLFPRTQVTSLQNLAQQLTSPFHSPTDKARAIFTWLHHNISYDVENFFRGTVKGSTPQSTLQSGLAVCEGYAALFTNLATYAGLESIVISGHGKGYGYSPLSVGSPLPPYNAGHAWNAVKIDHGEWKLIDTCWGAGHVQGKGMPYTPKFTPEYFSMTNEDFGIKHFPGNKEHFFLPGGRRMSWEEYIQINPEFWPSMVEGPTVFTNAKEDYYIGNKTVMPRSRKISVSQGGIVRFQFGLLCPHWTLERHTDKGPPPVFIVSTHGIDGRNKDYIVMEHFQGNGNGNGGDLWYADIPAKELGAPGQTVSVFSVRTFDDRQDARGLTTREFREGKGRVGMGFTGVAAWDLV